LTQQIKHETGHVQFRVLRESAIGQNSLQLSSSTAAYVSHQKGRLAFCSHLMVGIPRLLEGLDIMTRL
jgi:hypothetical protein